MITEEEIIEDLEQLETEEEIQRYLENLWEEARRDADNLDRMRRHFEWDNMDLDEIMQILEEKDLSQFEAEHK